MSTEVARRVKRGDLVYEKYRPAHPGVALEGFVRTVGKGHPHEREVKMCWVRWIDGHEEAVHMDVLNDLLALVADHEKKLATHKDSVKAIQRVADEVMA